MPSFYFITRLWVSQRSPLSYPVGKITLIMPIKLSKIKRVQLINQTIKTDISSDEINMGVVKKTANRPLKLQEIQNHFGEIRIKDIKMKPKKIVNGSIRSPSTRSHSPNAGHPPAWKNFQDFDGQSRKLLPWNHFHPKS